jgi:hypothetical protein
MSHKKAKKGRLSVWSSDDIFDKDALEAVLHTQLTSDGSKRGTPSYSLLDLFDVAKVREKGNASRFLADVTPRERDTRWDVRLSSLWVEKMKKVNVAFQDACELAEGVKRMTPVCKRAKIEWHAMIVHPGSSDQSAHEDNSDNRCYYTLIVPLTSVANSGGTSLPYPLPIFKSFGGALVFDGNVTHFGIGNRSSRDRIFLYAAIFSETDAN